MLIDVFYIYYIISSSIFISIYFIFTYYNLLSQIVVTHTQSSQFTDVMIDFLELFLLLHSIISS